MNYLFNIAQTYRLAGNCVKAAELYGRFLAAVPHPPKEEKIFGRLIARTRRTRRTQRIAMPTRRAGASSARTRTARRRRTRRSGRRTMTRSVQLPLGGTRTAVGMNPLAITEGEDDTIGWRFVPTVGLNFRIPKIRLGVGLRFSWTKVMPSNTLVEATDGTSSTWSAEGGGASYFSLGVQFQVYPFRSM